MTIEEAIKGLEKEIDILNQLIVDYQIIGQEELSIVSEMRNRIKNYQMAIAALEKQIPKKTKKNIMGVYCPVCKNLLDGTERFCLYCGQKIDWSEVEE